MRQLFVFTAGDKAARAHLADSVTSKVPCSCLKGAMPVKDADYYESLIDVEGGFYAWGAVPGPVNKRTWDSMQCGDQVLTVYDNRYRFVSSVVAKFHNQELAKRIWGTDDQGRTWEFMYALSRPVPIDVGVLEGPAPDFLSKGYRGFTRISDEKVQRAIEHFGSLEAFMTQVFGVDIPRTSVESALAAVEIQAEQTGAADFKPESLVDGREKVLQEVVRRRGQPKFRRQLIQAYQGTCVVTGCKVESVLEAAHIAAYLGEASNSVQNGLLMRADIHTLFDIGLLKITAEGTVQIHDTLRETEYKVYDGRKIAEPVSVSMRPSIEALAHKYSLVL